MPKKILYIFPLLGAVILFGIVSALVVISRRNPYFIQKKLRAGALIIMLTTLSSCFPPSVSCYSPLPPPDKIELITSVDDEIYVGTDVTLQAVIYERVSTEFSAALINSAGSIVLRMNISASDGVYDNKTENIEIIFTAPSEAGSYFLRFYPVSEDLIEEHGIDNTSSSYEIQIID